VGKSQWAEQSLAASPHAYSFPRLSPDGRRLAVDIAEQDEATNIWLYDLFREGLTRFTFEGTLNQPPAWTTDSKRIAFRSDKERPTTNIFWQLADGSGGLEPLTTNELPPLLGRFLPAVNCSPSLNTIPSRGRASGCWG